MDQEKNNFKIKAFESTLVVLCIFAVYLMLVLLSFHPSDPTWSQTAWHHSVHNIGGDFGAWTAGFLFLVFGLCAYTLPPVIFLFCVITFRENKKSKDYFRLSLRLIGAVLLILTSCVLADLHLNDFYYFLSGGLLGYVVNHTMLLHLNHVTLTMLFLFIWVLAVRLLTGCSWLLIAEKTGMYAMSLVNFIRRPCISKTVPPKEKCPPLFDHDIQTDGDFVDPDRKTTAFEITDTKKMTPAHQVYEQSRAEKKDQTSDLTQGQQPMEPVKPAQPVQPVEPIEHMDEMADLIEINQPVEPIKNINKTADLIDTHQSVDPVKSIDGKTGLIEVSQPVEPEDKVVPLALDNKTSFAEPSITAITPGINHFIHPFLIKNTPPPEKPDTPLPTLALLKAPTENTEPVDRPALEKTARLLEERLADYRVKAEVVGISQGPVITRFELDLAPGVKVARISSLSRDLARSLSAVSVRVVEVIPGKPYVGLELPNKNRQTVYLREVLDCELFQKTSSPLAVVLGKDISGHPVVADLAKMPHLLVAGTTGSGKSVGVNTMILSILYKATPDDVRFIMIDPKMLELSVYEGIPHLLTEVVTDMKDAANALRWSVAEMERRYKLMSALGVRNLTGYNERIQQAGTMGRPVPDPFWKPCNSMDLNPPLLEKLPYIVVMVDEFADLMMTVGKKVEELIARLAQKARAAGIHLVLATQRPSVDVITGLIKANIPTRIAFTVSSKIDSRTILDQSGAESLLGMGDMLYMAPNSSVPIRVQGAFVRDQEVHAVVNDWKARGRPQYIEGIFKSAEDSDFNGLENDNEELLDPLFDQAVHFVLEKRRASISGIQRQFRIGYNRAARIIEQMEAQQIVSSPGQGGNRQVLSPSGLGGLK